MRLKHFIRRLARATCALAGFAVSGCDDGTVITRTDVRGDAAAYFVLSGPEGLPTEVHGAPFPGVTPEWVVEHLKAPPALPTGIRFRAVPVGAHNEAPRLLLVFNRSDPPDASRDCRRAAPVPVQSPRLEGFSVMATVCHGNAMVATSHMEARKTRADDPEGFSHAMRLLLMQIAVRSN